MTLSEEQLAWIREHFAEVARNREDIIAKHRDRSTKLVKGIKTSLSRTTAEKTTNADLIRLLTSTDKAVSAFANVAFIDEFSNVQTMLEKAGGHVLNRNLVEAETQLNELKEYILTQQNGVEERNSRVEQLKKVKAELSTLIVELQVRAKSEEISDITGCESRLNKVADTPSLLSQVEEGATELAAIRLEIERIESAICEREDREVLEQNLRILAAQRLRLDQLVRKNQAAFDEALDDEQEPLTTLAEEIKRLCAEKLNPSPETVIQKIAELADEYEDCKTSIEDVKANKELWGELDKAYEGLMTGLQKKYEVSSDDELADVYKDGEIDEDEPISTRLYEDLIYQRSVVKNEVVEPGDTAWRDEAWNMEELQRLLDLAGGNEERSEQRKERKQLVDRRKKLYRKMSRIVDDATTVQRTSLTDAFSDFDEYLKEKEYPTSEEQEEAGKQLNSIESLLKAVNTRREGNKKTASERDDADGGHSIARHGPDVTSQDLEKRVTTGITPDGIFAPPPRMASRFISYDLWLETRDRAFDSKSDIIGEDGTKVPTGRQELHVNLSHGKKVGTAIRGVGDPVEVTKRDITGRRKTGNVFEDYEVVPELQRTYTLIAWNSASGRWVVAKHYPQ